MVEPSEQLRGRQKLRPRCRELDRERQRVEPAADRAHGVNGLALMRTHEKQLGRLVLDERWYFVFTLGGDAQRFTTCDKQLQIWRRLDGLCELRRALDHLLEVVEYEEHAAIANVRGKLADAADRCGDRREDDLGVAHRRQRYPEDAVLELVDRVGRNLKREPCLAAAAGPGERHERRRPRRARGASASSRPTTDELRRLRGQCRPVKRHEWRELPAPELVEPLRRGQILQPVLSQIR